MFDFGNKQRLHTQLHGNTTGKELFKVDEYNTQNKKIKSAIVVNSFIFATLYFLINEIPLKLIIFLLLIVIFMFLIGYSGYKNKKHLKQNLYN